MDLEFHTNSFHGASRLDYWREVICRHQLTIATESDADQEFQGSIRFRDWGEIQVSDVDASPVHYRRSTKEVRQSQRDDFLYVYYLAGTGALETATGVTTCTPGDLLIYDLNQVHSMRFPVSARTIVARIPRPLFADRVRQAGRQFSLRIGSDCPMAQFSGSILQNIFISGATPKAAFLREAAHSLVDMLSIAVNESLGDSHLPSPGQLATLEKIKSNLLNQLEDESLNVVSIAKAHGVSARTLNRMFAAEGTTVMRWLWKQRLTASYQALSHGDVRQVTEAAFAFGFKDCSHFARAFQKEFKIQPRKLLYQS